jgi:hypothetical protein
MGAEVEDGPDDGVADHLGIYPREAPRQAVGKGGCVRLEEVGRSRALIRCQRPLGHVPMLRGPRVRSMEDSRRL